MKRQRPSLGPCFNDNSSNIQDLSKLLRWLLAAIRFSHVKMRSDCRWTPKSLVVAAITWAFAGENTLAQRFQLAVDLSSRICRSKSLRRLSYQAFMSVLGKHTPTLLPAVVTSLRQRMQTSEHFTLNGRMVFAVDGTKVLLPKTKSNEKAYAKTRKRKQTRTDVGATTESGHLRNKVPQFYVTMLWNIGTQLLWDWRAGPSNASETEHLEEMIAGLPVGSLIVADAGFIGYDLWKQVFDRGHDWLVRVGANVKLLRKLGFSREYGSTVYYWPKAKRQKGLPPMVFRLVRIDGGKHPVYLLTNLPARELSDRQVGQLYRKRWGIEVYYRTFKCTLGRGKLRSYNAQNAKLELEWSLVGLWAIALTALFETGIDPPKLSMAGVIRAVREAMTHHRARRFKGEPALAMKLAVSKIDCYERKRKACRHPTIRTRNYRASREPKKVEASPTEIRKAISLKKKIRLTA